MPGFIDAHIHFPQYRMLAAPGKDLLDWLTRFTFPEESRYADPAHAAAAADIFLGRLFQHGTTAAQAFCSVHKACAEALFTAAEARGMALVTGKTMMDRNAIPAVQDDPETGARETEELYKRLARQGQAPLCRHAAFRHHLIRSAAQGGGRIVGVPSRRADADASLGEPRRDRHGGQAVSKCERLHRRL